MAKIAIIGGHGKIALRAERILATAGHDVTAIIRSPDHAEDVRAAGARATVIDVENTGAPALAEAVTGYNCVIWSAGAGGGNPARTFAVDRDAAIRSMDAAMNAGVRRYIMVSYSGASLNHSVARDNSFFPYAQAKAEADDYLKHTSLDWTILGPSRLTDEAGSGHITVTGGRGDNAHVSRDNVAAVLAAVIDAGNTIERVIEFDDGQTPIDQAIASIR